MRAIFGDVEWTQSDHRRLRIIDALFKSAERQGIGVATSRGTSLQFELLGQQICFKLRQRHRQVKRRKQPEEIHSPGDSTWKYQLLPTGAMILVFERLPAGFRREWKDLKDLPLEQQLADIISTVRARAPALVQQHEDRDRADAKRRAAAARLKQEQERLEVDAARWRRFVELAQQWREAETARQFLTALEQQSDTEATIGGKPLTDWLAWARDSSRRYDPINGAAAVFEAVVEAGQWPSLHDSPGDPYRD
jgi:hypothetical protein